MNREEIEKLLEESGRKARGEGRGTGITRYKVRTVLNWLFLLAAVVGLVVYFLVPESRVTGLLIVFAGMVLKMVEFALRFLG